MTDITKCYTRAAGTFVIATFDPRTIVSYFIVSSFLKSRHEPLRHRHFCMANRRISENRKSRFAIMLARSMKTGLFDIVENKMNDDFEWSRMGMAVRTGAELQAARKAAAERFTAIAMQHVPEGYTVEYRKSLSGRHYGQSKRIQAPRPVTRKSLYIFLHECAHAHLHVDRKPKAHVREMEAEKWAHEKMREHGIAVPRDMTKRAKDYVARKIAQAKRSGAKSIDPEAARYART